jgi:hypothetical protein
MASTRIVIDHRDILQINATVIAGILVLLTIANLSGTNRIQYATAIMQAIFPFGLSAFVIIMASFVGDKFKPLISFAKVATAVGFVVLMGSVANFLMFPPSNQATN